MPDPRFTDIGDGTVADTLTGLIWAKDASSPTVNACVGGTKTWQSALDYVTCLNSTVYLGHSDWLLPNINELKSLIDVQNGVVIAHPAGSPFTGVRRGDYWSSSTNAVNTGYAWIVASYDSMGGGEVYFRHKTWDYYVWPVRGGQWPTSTLSLPKTGQTISYASGDDGAQQRGVPEPRPRFTTNGDGTVTDNRTGLIWLKNAHCFSSKVWSDAVKSANTLASGSCGLVDGSVAGDWRLPNREELASLVDRGRSSPALPDANPFNDVQYFPYYWASSTYAYDTGTAWSVNVFDGVVGCYFKSSGNYVWPVRGG